MHVAGYSNINKVLTKKNYELVLGPLFYLYASYRF